MSLYCGYRIDSAFQPNEQGIYEYNKVYNNVNLRLTIVLQKYNSSVPYIIIQRAAMHILVEGWLLSYIIISN